MIRPFCFVLALLIVSLQLFVVAACYLPHVALTWLSQGECRRLYVRCCGVESGYAACGARRAAFPPPAAKLCAALCHAAEAL